MKYKIYDRKFSSLSKTIDIVVIVMLLISISLIFVGLYENMIIITALLYFFNHLVLKNKLYINKEGSPKNYINKPIIVENNHNIYFFLYKSIINYFLIIPIIFMIIGYIYDEIFPVAFALALIIIEIVDFVEKYNLNRIKNNPDIIDNVKISKKLLQINNIKKIDEEVFVVDYGKFKQRQVSIPNNYNNYEELIQIFNNNSTK